MRLFIAEKPSVAKAIAEELGITSKKEGYFICGGDRVSYCFGHMLELAAPDDYTPYDVPKVPGIDKKIWRVDELPIIPQQWLISPKDDAIKQLKVIAKLIDEADTIINAGDADREGQLLIDEVLDHFNNTKPVLRFWVSSHDTISLQRGLANLKDNVIYKGFGEAAKARSYADWLIGMNLSRAYTLAANRGGSKALIPVGRVQTPTLSLVVKRDREIENFKPIIFYQIKADISAKGMDFTCNWKSSNKDGFASDGDGLDSEERLINDNIAYCIADIARGSSGQVVEYQDKPCKKNHPLAFSLSDITLLASNQFGYSAAEVLEICQSLYETHKLTSYPRTDCAYLPESQYQDAALVLEAIKYVNPDLAHLIDKADSAIKSKTWDDSKVGVHHGIIPTMQKGDKSKLTLEENNIYQFIVKAYIAQFYPLYEYLSTSITLEIMGEKFETKGQTIIKAGWRSIFIDEEKIDAESAQTLPKLQTEDEVQCTETHCIPSKTKPPAYFTEGTLQKAMENIHKYMEDSEHKKMLRDGDGIGTSATRANILNELKNRNFLEIKGKQIRSTVLGQSIIDALPEAVKSPVLTAIYERYLKDIEKDSSHFEPFLKSQEKFVTDQVLKIKDKGIKIKGAESIPIPSTVHKCKNCQKGLIYRKTKKGFLWSCSGYPVCTISYKGNKGRPIYVQ